LLKQKTEEILLFTVHPENQPKPGFDTIDRVLTHLGANLAGKLLEHS
jgi:hypothetical protein